MSTAATGAERDRVDWSELLARVETTLAAAREVDVTGYDPIDDLQRRGRWWSHRFESDRLADVVAFGVALAEVEVRTWREDDPVVATRAFEDRRFLFSDRLVHWVVPFTFIVDGAETVRRELLEMGDRLRPAPLLTGDEGMHPPGEDSFGPLEVDLRVDLGEPQRWAELADSHPGTARLWRDLGRRALIIHARRAR